MKTYQLSTGILQACIVRHTEKQVIIKIIFEGFIQDYIYINRSDFNNLDQFIKNQYTVIN